MRSSKFAPASRFSRRSRLRLNAAVTPADHCRPVTECAGSFAGRRRAGTRHRCQATRGGSEEAYCGGRVEIADGGPGKKPRRCAPNGGSCRGWMKSATTGSTVSTGMRLPEAFAHGAQRRRRDIDRDIGGERRTRVVQQDTGLGFVAAAEFDQRGIAEPGRHQRRADRCQQGGFSAGQIIFRQTGNLIEQPTALVVVEQHRRQRFARRCQAG